MACVVDNGHGLGSLAGVDDNIYAGYAGAVTCAAGVVPVTDQAPPSAWS